MSDKKSKVEFYGRVAKFPKNVEASKAYNFLENIKVNKKKNWYMIVEKENGDNGEVLQTIKYNYKQGVNLEKFVKDLKAYYIKRFASQKPDIDNIMEGLIVEGSDRFATIKNIPNVEIEGKKLITHILNDLVMLLSKIWKKPY